MATDNVSGSFTQLHAAPARLEFFVYLSISNGMKLVTRQAPFQK